MTGVFFWLSPLIIATEEFHLSKKKKNDINKLIQF